jgi:hypothetical protein
MAGHNPRGGRSDGAAAGRREGKVVIEECHVPGHVPRHAFPDNKSRTTSCTRRPSAWPLSRGMSRFMMSP